MLESNGCWKAMGREALFETAGAGSDAGAFERRSGKTLSQHIAGSQGLGRAHSVVKGENVTRERGVRGGGGP